MYSPALLLLACFAFVFLNMLDIRRNENTKLSREIELISSYFCLMEYAASVRIIRLVTRTGNHNLIWLATARQRPQPGVAEITVISAHPAATSICLLAPSSYDSAASQAPPGCASLGLCSQLKALHMGVDLGFSWVFLGVFPFDFLSYSCYSDQGMSLGRGAEVRPERPLGRI